MEYLFNYRFKLLNSLQVNLTSLLATKESGDGKAFKSTLNEVREWMPHLSVLKSAPFTTQEIGLVKKLEKLLKDMLTLEEDFLSICTKAQKQNAVLLDRIEPFIFSMEDTNTDHIISTLEQICSTLEGILLNKKGLATPLKDEEAHVNTLFEELEGTFSKKGNEELFKLFLLYQSGVSFSSLEDLEDLLAAAKATLVSYLINKKELFYSLAENIIELFKEHETNLTSEVNQYPLFFQVFTNDDTKAMVEALLAHKEAKTHKKVCKSIRQNYAEATKEKGATIISRLRGIGFFKQLQKNIQSLSN